RRSAFVTGCKPGQNKPGWTSKRSTSFVPASLRTRVETSTAAPIFVTRPEFSICRPFNAFDHSAISRTCKSLSVYRTISASDVIGNKLSRSWEICTADYEHGVLSLLDEFGAA